MLMSKETGPCRSISRKFVSGFPVWKYRSGLLTGSRQSFRNSSSTATSRCSSMPAFRLSRDREVARAAHGSLQLVTNVLLLSLLAVVSMVRSLNVIPGRRVSDEPGILRFPDAQLCI